MKPLFRSLEVTVVLDEVVLSVIPVVGVVEEIIVDVSSCALVGLVAVVDVVIEIVLSVIAGVVVTGVVIVHRCVKLYCGWVCLNFHINIEQLWVFLSFLPSEG